MFVMRILYLLYNKQESLIEFGNNTKINLSWVDALFDALFDHKDIDIGIVVPINDSAVQKVQKDGLVLYGLPDPDDDGILKKAFKRYTRAQESPDINSNIPEVIEDFKPDIIQIFGTENPFGLIAKNINIPVVIHLQGYLFVLQEKWFAGISKWEQFKYSSLKDLLLMRGYYYDSYKFKRKGVVSLDIIKSCKYFMGRTNFDRSIIKLISPEANYFHCEEFIRQDFFDIKWDLPYQNEITCVSILKGGSYKGIDLLVETFMILNKYSDLTFKLKICGVSDNEEIVKIINKKYRNGIKQINIEFLGRLSAGDLVKQLCSSNFYIHPSYLENSPNSICEAMALGMPIIATKVGGVTSLIKEDIEGSLVQEGEPYAMAAAIIELTKNYEKAKQLGTRARKRAAERHQPDDILKNLLKIYDKILEGD